MENQEIACKCEVPHVRAGFLTYSRHHPYNFRLYDVRTVYCVRSYISWGFSWFYRVGILRPSKMGIGCPLEIKWTSRCGERNKRKTGWLLQSIIFGKMAEPRGKLSLVKFPLTTWVDLHLPSKLVRHSMLKMLTLKAFNTNSNIIPIFQ